jgi:small subunit ribosomal protein S17
MADEPDNETSESTAAEAENMQAPEAEAQAPEPTEAATPEAEAPATEAPEADAPETPEPETPEPETPEADAPEAATPEPDAPATEAPEADAPATPTTAAVVEPVEQLSPKERRRKARSTHSGEAGPTRSPEDRHAERVTERRAKAVSRRARRLSERAKAAKRRAAKPAAEPLAPVHAAVEGKRSVRQGIVVSDKADKTITVRIDFARRHRRYEKIVRSSSTLHAHDENNDAHEGDVVRVIESRPLSKNKRWKLVDVVDRAR